MAHLFSSYSHAPATALGAQLSNCFSPDQTDASCTDAGGYLPSEYWSNSPSRASFSFKTLPCTDLWAIKGASANYTISPSETTSEFFIEDPFSTSFHGNSQTLSMALDFSRSLVTSPCSNVGDHGHLKPVCTPENCLYFDADFSMLALHS